MVLHKALGTVLDVQDIAIKEKDPLKVGRVFLMIMEGGHCYGEWALKWEPGGGHIGPGRACFEGKVALPWP